MPFRRKILSALAAGTLALSGLAVGAAPAQAATYLGGVDVGRYCATNVPSGNPYVASKPVNINNRWDGWRCAKINGSLVTIDMNLACRQQYPKPWLWSANAYATHGTGMYSWACYR